MEIKSLTFSDAKYPEILRQIYDPPSEIFYCGNLEVLERKIVAIVGTRMASAHGAASAFTIAKEMSERGICVVSGLAFGIDAAAHRGALEGVGGTIAVIAQDLEHLMPSSHYGLAMEIVKKGGLLISEKGAPGETFKHEYLKRNRIISALSEAVLVVEAAFKSGALNTARHAIEQGKGLMMLPGRITDEQSRGTNKMGKELDCFVCDMNEIWEKLGMDKIDARVKLSGIEKKIFKSLKDRPQSISELCEFFNAAEVYAAVSVLEISGLVSTSGSGVISILDSS